jgi:hypothetical protein
VKVECADDQLIRDCTGRSEMVSIGAERGPDRSHGGRQPGAAWRGIGRREKQLDRRDAGDACRRNLANVVGRHAADRQHRTRRSGGRASKRRETGRSRAGLRRARENGPEDNVVGVAAVAFCLAGVVNRTSDDPGGRRQRPGPAAAALRATSTRSLTTTLVPVPRVAATTPAVNSASARALKSRSRI